PGVTTEVLQPVDLSNHAPELRIKWDEAAVGITGKEVEKILLDGNPRIILGGSTASTLTIMPYMMMPNDHKIAADAIYAVLSKPPKIEAPVLPAGDPSNVAGQWDVKMELVSGLANHRVILEPKGKPLVGSPAGRTLT